jgi:hypothetical protein
MDGWQSGESKKMRMMKIFSIMVLAKEKVKKNEEARGSFYTSRGKRRWLGSMPSVSLREIEQISRKGHTI